MKLTCKQDILDIFLKDSKYKITYLNEEDNLIQINYINFSLTKEKSTNLGEIPSYYNHWLTSEWKQAINSKGKISQGTSGVLRPYVEDYFYYLKEVRRQKIKQINES